MTEQQAQWAISTLADVRVDRPCIRVRAAGVAWAFFAEYGDLTISVYGGGSDDPVPGLIDIGFARRGGPLPTTPADVPVVFLDVDLFGYPFPEVEEALAALTTRGSSLAEEFGLTLRRPAAAVQRATRRDRKPRHPANEEPAAAHYLVSATLTHPDGTARSSRWSEPS